MHVKESLLFDWMKFGSYRLINYIWPYMAVPPSFHTPHMFHLVLDQLCPMDSVHFNIILVQHWNLIFSLWPQNIYLPGGPSWGWEIALRPKDWQQVPTSSFIYASQYSKHLVSQYNICRLWRKAFPTNLTKGINRTFGLSIWQPL